MGITMANIKAGWRHGLQSDGRGEGGLKPVRLAVACCLTAAILLGGAARAQDLILKASVDQEVVAQNQQFTITIEISGPAVQSAIFPELPNLSQFADFLGSSTAQNMTIVNGKMSVTKSSLNYYTAHAVGNFTIPPITLDFKGKTYTTEAIDIRVVKGSTQNARPNRGRGSGLQPQSELEGNIFLRVEANRTTVYQNEPIVLSYKIYTRVEVSNYSITETPGLVGFWSEDFQLPKTPVTYEENVNGKRFLVAEIKKTALFPTVTGEKTIDPMVIECEVRLRQRQRSRDIFDQFFLDDNSLFGRRARTTISSDPLTIEVKPLPAEGKPMNFSGAVGRFDLEASLDKSQVAAHEAVTLSVVFSGTGNIKILPLPQLNFPNGFEVYEPKEEQKINRSGEFISGKKTFEFVFIPRIAGKHRIRPVTFSYFDTGVNAYRTLRSPEFTLEVTPGEATGVPYSSGLTREEIKLVGRDIRFIKENSGDFRPIGVYFYQSVWFVLLLAAPLLGVAYALFHHSRQDKMALNEAYARSRRANKTAKRRLAAAEKLMGGDQDAAFYAEVSNALLGFVADKLNLAAAGLVADDVSAKLRHKGIAEKTITEVMAILKDCDFYRFAPSNSSQADMKGFYDRAAQAIGELEKAKMG